MSGIQDAPATSSGLIGTARRATGDIDLYFLSEEEQTGQEVATLLASFIGDAQHSLSIAIYDFRLSTPLRVSIDDALHTRAAAGVAIRIVYDADKPDPPDLLGGMDPAPSGTGAFVQSLGVPYRRIGGLKLMHQKYAVRDAGLPGARVWTGSTNFTDDSWQLCDNNIVQLASPELSLAYARDFEELWQHGHIEGTGSFDPQLVDLAYRDLPLRAGVQFSPGRGEAINQMIATRVRAARRRVRLCSMLLNSGELIAALSQLLDSGVVPIDGVYDQTQMVQVFEQWQGVPHNHWKIPAVQRIIADARLVGKHSTPYSPGGRHDFMHNKILVIDNTVITGSYNFSHSAEFNAENVLTIESAAFADAYSRYIDHLKEKYAS
jgi:phosphatidylserine/phosphatidylglycerophosphate/cardiolipin synthase-like enzyme